MVVQKHSCTSSLADAASATCLPTPSLAWWQGECHRCDLEEKQVTDGLKKQVTDGLKEKQD